MYCTTLHRQYRKGNRLFWLSTSSPVLSATMINVSSTEAQNLGFPSTPKGCNPDSLVGNLLTLNSELRTPNSRCSNSLYRCYVSLFFFKKLVNKPSVCPLYQRPKILSLLFWFCYYPTWVQTWDRQGDLSLEQRKLFSYPPPPGYLAVCPATVVQVLAQWQKMELRGGLQWRKTGS